MMKAGFWMGMGAGLLAGAAAMGMMKPESGERSRMKTQLGKSIHKLGVAVDRAVDSIAADFR